MGEPSFLDNKTFHTVNSIKHSDIRQNVVLQPIPRTLEPEMDDGVIYVRAELLTDGGATPDEVGFIISKKLMSGRDIQVLK